MCVSVCDHTHMHIVVSKGQKRVSDVLGLELQMTVTCWEK